MRYRLRTLHIALAVAPPLLALAWWICATERGQLYLPMAALVIACLVTWFSFAPERRFRREVASREPLDDAEFIRQCYPGSEIPPDVPLRLRPIYCRYFDIEIGKLRPADRPPEIVDLDTVDLVREIEQAFGITISDQDAENIDGSFDSIVRHLASRRAAMEMPAST
jgi:hypothetical protein